MQDRRSLADAVSVQRVLANSVSGAHAPQTGEVAVISIQHLSRPARLSDYIEGAQQQPYRNPKRAEKKAARAAKAAQRKR